jgi:hypothetical protein
MFMCTLKLCKTQVLSRHSKTGKVPELNPDP